MVSNQKSDYVYTKRCRRRIDGLHHLQCDIVCLLAIGRVLTPRPGESLSLSSTRALDRTFTHIHQARNLPLR